LERLRLELEPLDRLLVAWEVVWEDLALLNQQLGLGNSLLHLLLVRPLELLKRHLLLVQRLGLASQLLQLDSLVRLLRLDLELLQQHQLGHLDSRLLWEGYLDSRPPLQRRLALDLEPSLLLLRRLHGVHPQLLLPLCLVLPQLLRQHQLLVSSNQEPKEEDSLDKNPRSQRREALDLGSSRDRLLEGFLVLHLQVPNNPQQVYSGLLLRLLVSLGLLLNLVCKRTLYVRADMTKLNSPYE
jgi:hypothetical protein